MPKRGNKRGGMSGTVLCLLLGAHLLGGCGGKQYNCPNLQPWQGEDGGTLRGALGYGLARAV
jgi:hypothetical protein